MIMKISEIFNLGKSQAELDFVDIDPSLDTALFLDPHFLSQRSDRWSQDAARTVKIFFRNLLDLLKSGDTQRAKTIFYSLSEPNETCLGLSRGSPQGRGVGAEDTQKIFESIQNSQAIISGLVEDLEDCVIFVENFGKDKLSDMTTNIIRLQLIEYTREQANLWDIPLSPAVQMGPCWDTDTSSWVNEHGEMLVVNGRRILLVPKGVVSYSKDYTPVKYHQHFVLNYLQDEHLKLNSSLVRRDHRKDGSIRVYVTKKDIKETESPGTKEYLIRFTEKHPSVFKKFKEEMKGQNESLTDSEFSDIDIESIIDHLMKELNEISPGREDASRYHDLIIGILELLFYPDVISPVKEQRIHEGRKRIDIVFDNAAESGIFHDLHEIHRLPCQYIFMECKNYSGDPNNPELDQLAGRFSPNRGKAGFLICRTIENMDLFLSRCIDTYRDDRGLIIPIVDSDLIKAMKERKNNKRLHLNKILRDRQREIQLKS